MWEVGDSTNHKRQIFEIYHWVRFSDRLVVSRGHLSARFLLEVTYIFIYNIKFHNKHCGLEFYIIRKNI